MQNMVYVSGALTDLPDGKREAYLQFYEQIGEVIRSVGLTPYVPHLNTDPVRHKDVTPTQVDEIDRTAVTASALMIAVVDNPSLGVGIEIEMAVHAAKAVLLVCSELHIKERKISRLVRGSPAVIAEIHYKDFEDALAKVAACITTFLQSQLSRPFPDILKIGGNR